MRYDNDVIALLRENRSIREFTDQEILPEIKEQILLAGCAAPTGGNQQPYTILDITDDVIQKQLAELCDHQPFIAEAKMVFVFCADPVKWHDAYVESGAKPRHPGIANLYMGIVDAMIAAQNCVTAAASYGIGSCYIGDVVENCERVRELLRLPEGVMPAGMVVFGYPTPRQKERVKPARSPLSHIVAENTYPHMDQAYRKELFEPKAGLRSYEEWISLMCNRKHNADFFAEMNRSITEYMKYYQKDR